MLFLPLLSLLLFLSKFIRKRRKRFPSFASSFASHLHFVSTFFSLQERVCGGITTPQERFCGASSPTRMILWSVITHKNDFCERQPCPTRTTNSWTANLVFANSHIILPSIWLALSAAMSFRNIGRKMSGALKKVTGSSSSRSSSHRSSTPTPSYTHQDEQAESQAPEEQPAQQEEEEAPNDSHLDIQG